MSFWVFLSLVPLAAVAGLVAARVATSDTSMGSALLRSVPPALRQIVDKQARHVASWDGGTVGPIAAVTFVWLAAGGVHAVFDALEVQSGTSRPWWKKRLLAIATCVALSVGVAILGFLAAGLEAVAALAGRALPAGVMAVTHGATLLVTRYVLAALLAVGMVAGLYRVGVPRRPGARYVVLPGAIAAVLLQGALVWGYTFWISHLGSSDAYRTGLALIGVGLMTLWLTSLALLLGVQLNRALEEHAKLGLGPDLAGRLRRFRAWLPFAKSSSPPTSQRPPTERSSGPSSSPRVSPRP